MLGSDHDGERASAAFQANKLLRDAGFTWHELIEAARRNSNPKEQKQQQSYQAPPPPKSDQSSTHTWQERVTACLNQPHLFTAWEFGFLNNMNSWTGDPTEKQWAVMKGLFARVKV